MKSKKGSADMWWIIIGAVIALVVMIVLMVMFTQKSGKVEGGLLDCEGKSGQCQPSVDLCRSSGGTVSTAFDCGKYGASYVCCFTSGAR